MKSRIQLIGLVGVALSVGLISSAWAGSAYAPKGGAQVSGGYSSRGFSVGGGYSSGGHYYGGGYYNGGGHYSGGGYYCGNRYYGGGCYRSGYYGGWGCYGIPWGLSFSFYDSPRYYAPEPVYYYPSPTVVYSQPPTVVYSAPTPVTRDQPAPPVADHSQSPPANKQEGEPPKVQNQQSAKPSPQPQSLGLVDVKALVTAGISDEVIISQMQSAGVVYHLTTAELIDLKESGVSNKVLNFMVNTPNQQNR